MKGCRHNVVSFRVPRGLSTAGFALVATLVLLVLLTVMAVGFMSSALLERSTSRAYSNAERAREAADAATDHAIARLVTNMVAHPYHAIGYHAVAVAVEGEASTEQVPVLAFPDPGNNQTLAYRYLCSSPQEDVLATLTTENSVALNQRSLSKPEETMGSPNTGYLAHRAQWVSVLRDPSLTPEPDPASPQYNPVIARYAFWVQDQTSKIDFGVVGNDLADDGSGFRRGDGILPEDLDLGALPLIDGKPLGGSNSDTAINRDILGFRQTLCFLDPRFLNRASGSLSESVYDLIKFYGTIFSLSNDLSGKATRRANLNALFFDSADSAVIRRQLQDFGSVVNTGITDEIGIPVFGRRFFPHAPDYPHTWFDQYVEKVAANVRDYIDSDSQPTFVDVEGNVISGTRPSIGWQQGEEPRAIGKECVPYFQEHCWRGREVEWVRNGKTATYTVEIDHYFEFFNVTTKDWVAPEGTFLKVLDRPFWAAGTYADLEPPDFEMDLSGVRFPAGQATVVTTDPNWKTVPDLIQGEEASVVQVDVDESARSFHGMTDEVIGGRPGLQLNNRVARDSGSSVTDYSTEMIFGTDLGYLDAHPYIAISNAGSRAWNFKGDRVNQQETYFFYSSSLRGNDSPSRSGDPRSVSEQISMLPYSSGGDSDQTRFFGGVQQSGLPGTSTLGRAYIRFVDPRGWPDYQPPFPESGTDRAELAPAVIRDGPMHSIGELGYIYDPHRKAGFKANIVHARGGGRTLKIGQPDDLALSAGGEKERFQDKWWEAAWRLCDIFSAGPESSGDEPPAVPDEPTSRGRINLNGVARDGGVALRAALRGFEFQSAPDSDPDLAGANLGERDIDDLIESVADYIETNGPFLERGELSEISFFGYGSGSQVPVYSNGTAPGPNSVILATKDFRTLNDRGREELFRRMVELVTTRSASFTIYAVAEAVKQKADGTLLPMARQKRATTIQLEPVVGSNLNDRTAAYRVRRVYETN